MSPFHLALFCQANKLYDLTQATLFKAFGSGALCGWLSQALAIRIKFSKRCNFPHDVIATGTLSDYGKAISLTTVKLIRTCWMLSIMYPASSNNAICTKSHSRVPDVQQ
jgi:hypothetical protein